MTTHNINPTVLVLLASYNGISWLTEQINSILHQENVNVKLVVSDDQSTDGSLELIRQFSERDHRITLLPSDQKFGSAGSNFYRLLKEACTEDFEYIALSDQDDIWLSNKLSNQIALIKKHKVDAVSSNVVAFWPEGKRLLVEKAQPIRKLDYLFESAGPGCTFLMTNALVNRVKTVLRDPKLAACSVCLHDWLIYTICRASGGQWWIDQRPTLKYRQHEKNVIGVNQGWAAWKYRLSMIVNKWYRDETLKLAAIAKQLSSDPYTQTACHAVLPLGVMRRFRLLKHIPQCRRNPAERMFLAAILLLGFY